MVISSVILTSAITDTEMGSQIRIVNLAFKKKESVIWENRCRFLHISASVQSLHIWSIALAVGHVCHLFTFSSFWGRQQNILESPVASQWVDGTRRGKSSKAGLWRQTAVATGTVLDEGEWSKVTRKALLSIHQDGKANKTNRAGGHAQWHQDGPGQYQLSAA